MKTTNRTITKYLIGITALALLLAAAIGIYLTRAISSTTQSERVGDKPTIADTCKETLRKYKQETQEQKTKYPEIKPTTLNQEDCEKDPQKTLNELNAHQTQLKKEITALQKKKTEHEKPNEKNNAKTENAKTTESKQENPNPTTTQQVVNTPAPAPAPPAQPQQYQPAPAPTPAPQPPAGDGGHWVETETEESWVCVSGTDGKPAECHIVP